MAGYETCPACGAVCFGNLTCPTCIDEMVRRGVMRAEHGAQFRAAAIRHGTVPPVGAAEAEAFIRRLEP